MNTNQLVKALVAVIIPQIALGASPDWENPEVIGINKLPYHATLNLPSNNSTADGVTMLNGEWYFNWAKDPDSRPADFYKADYDVSSWAKINVPGNWQTQGHDKPIYTNWTYPFAKDAPYVTHEPPTWYYSHDNRNPVGSYVTDFTLGDDVGSKSVYLHFDGVKSAMYVWVNGEKVGYSQNSMSPCEFDITPYVVPGNNRLAVEVYRWSDGSYLEDQDMWRLSGIFRDVMLLQKSKLNIRDYQVKTTLTDDMSKAQVDVDICVRNDGDKSKSNNLILSIGDHTISKPIPSIKKGSECTITVSTTIDNPMLWSAEKPNLYPVKIEIPGKDSINTHIGIRQIEIKDNALYVNGKRVKLRGVNRHEHHPKTGRYVDEATMRRDLELMKQGNVNMVRTSHYPDAPLWYELCDIYGIYVMDEANHESHDYGIGTTTFGDDPLWRRAMVDRAVALVERDKNHPCVIFWSLGNEATAGANVDAMAEAIRAIDNTRPIYYDSDLSVSDIFDDAYASPERFNMMVNTVKDKPVMMREYAHAMGNSLGNLQEYWDIIYSNDNAIGAAIWDWVDQGLKISHPACKVAATDFAYGGDFGDTPNDGPFNINGIIDADRVPHPHYYEMQKVYQPLYFSYDNGKVKILNNDSFTDPSEYECSYQWIIDGKPTGMDSVIIDSDTFITNNMPQTEGELLLNVYATLKDDRIWAPKGHVVAKEQFMIHGGKAKQSVPMLSDVVFSQNIDSTWTVNAHGNVYKLSAKGDVMSVVINGKEQLAAKLEPEFWKMPVENDRRNNYESRQGEWRDAAATRRLLTTETSDSAIVFNFRLEAPGADYKLTYTFADDVLKVRADYNPYVCFKPAIPRFGFRFGLPESYDNIEWYGRGPVENYPDRKSNALIGIYQSGLDDFITNYPMPQENANRCDIRWCRFTNSNDGASVTVVFDEPGNFRAWPYLEESVMESKHPSELKDCGYININIDQWIQGVGGINSWGAEPLDEYKISSHLPLTMQYIIKFDTI